MKFSKGFMVLAGLATLSACSSFRDFDEVDALNEVQSVGSPFTQRLTEEYRAYVNSEIENFKDYADGIHFARKGLASARGDVVMPEPISDWNLMASHIEELSVARGRLVNVFDLGARELEPDLSAVAQARFDCWIEQQEDDWNAGVSYCKNEFLNALQRLEDAMRGQVPPPQPELPPVAEPFDVDPAEPMKVENAVYLVFFDFDESTLGPGAQSVLDAVAEEISKRSLNAVKIVGHTDTSGPTDYNQRLSVRRSNAIRDALVQRGVDPSLMRIESRGEQELLVQTADNMREPANRRGEITFE